VSDHILCKGVSFDSVSNSFRLDFRTVPKVWYVLFSNLLILGIYVHCGTEKLLRETRNVDTSKFEIRGVH
jgi:hypothetical protein